MNDTVKDFFLKHKISIDKLASQRESHILNTEEIDCIVDKYGFDGKKQMSNISIADIIGYDTYGENGVNIFYSFDNFFDQNGDGYHSRSCGLLDISSSNIIRTLNNSFTEEPIVVREIHDNQHLIYTNGLHRYTVLRTHFLNESFGLKKDTEEYESVRKKYTIPVISIKVDLIKTYCNYLLSKYPISKISLRTEYDENYNSTGNIIVALGDGKKQVMNNEQLLQFTKEAVLSVAHNQEYSNFIKNSQNFNPHFFQYIKTYIPELSIEFDSEKERGINR